MHLRNQSLRSLARRWTISASLAISVGCGFQRIELPIPDAIPNATLEQIREIQNDERLTVMEQQEAIRALVGAELTPEGDRLVNFLLNLSIP